MNELVLMYFVVCELLVKLGADTRLVRQQLLEIGHRARSGARSVPPPRAPVLR